MCVCVCVFYLFRRKYINELDRYGVQNEYFLMFHITYPLLAAGFKNTVTRLMEWSP